MKNETIRFVLSAFCATRTLLLISACLIAGSAPAFGQEEGPVTTVDETYGKGGKKTTVTFATIYVTTTIVSITDGKVIREERKTSIYKKTGKKSYEQLRYNDCKGNGTYIKTVEYDILGNEISFSEQRYNDGQQTSGFERGIRSDGTKYNQRFNPNTRSLEDIALDDGPVSDEISTPQPDTSACTVAAFPPNEIVGAFSLINEDSYPERFNTYGFNGAYTRFITPSVGITGDFNAHFRERNGTELSKLSALGGVTFVPFEGAKTSDKATVSFHALVGLSRFKADSGVGSFTDSAATVKLGGAIDVNAFNNFFIRLAQVDYAPTRFGGQTQHNFQVGFGLGVRWK